MLLFDYYPDIFICTGFRYTLEKKPDTCRQLKLIVIIQLNVLLSLVAATAAKLGYKPMFFLHVIRC